MRVLGALLVVVLLGACRSTVEPQAGALGAPPSTVPPPATVDPSRATFLLTVSNQSFREPRAAIMVTVDGRQVIAQDFDVKGQHNFVQFPLHIAPGRHALVATASARTRHQEAFTLPASGKRYGVLLYWNQGTEAPLFTWTFQVEPPAFA